MNVSFHCSKMCCRNTIICEKCFRSRIDLIFIRSSTRTFFHLIFILNVLRLCEKVYHRRAIKCLKKYYKFLELMLMCCVNEHRLLSIMVSSHHSVILEELTRDFIIVCCFDYFHDRHKVRLPIVQLL